MITEIRLNSNSESTARFWGAIFNVEPRDLGGGRWRIEPIAGPAIVVSTRAAWQAISRYADMTVVPFPGVADRLRALGFEVAADGSQAVDLNGCDNTVYFVNKGWDGISDFYEDDPTPEEKQRIERLLDSAPVTFTTGAVRRIESDDVASVSAFIAAWYGSEVEAGHEGMMRVVAGDELYLVEPAVNPQRRWYMLGAVDYAAAVERCAAAGFAVIPSAQAPDEVGQIAIGSLRFVVTVDRR